MSRASDLWDFPVCFDPRDVNREGVLETLAKVRSRVAEEGGAAVADSWHPRTCIGCFGCVQMHDHSTRCLPLGRPLVIVKRKHLGYGVQVRLPLQACKAGRAMDPATLRDALRAGREW